MGDYPADWAGGGMALQDAGEALKYARGVGGAAARERETLIPTVILYDRWY
jgi:hypothetical protein